MEVDRKWWQSNYAPPRFLQDMVFADEIDGKIPSAQNYALLFCYFNNGHAFCDYMRSTTSTVVFVIGPCERHDRFTNPMPFDEKFHDLGWQLLKSRKLQKSGDCISVFIKSDSNKSWLFNFLTNFFFIFSFTRFWSFNCDSLLARLDILVSWRIF